MPSQVKRQTGCITNAAAVRRRARKKGRASAGRWEGATGEKFAQVAQEGGRMWAGRNCRRASAVPSGIAIRAATMKQGAEANLVAATPGAIGRPQCGGGHATNARGRRWACDVVSRQHMHALREVCCILTFPVADLCPNLARSSPATAKLVVGRTSDCGSTFPGSRSAAEVLDGLDSVSWEKALDERRRARILLGSKTSIVPLPGAARRPQARLAPFIYR